MKEVLGDPRGAGIYAPDPDGLATVVGGECFLPTL